MLFIVNKLSCLVCLIPKTNCPSDFCFNIVIFTLFSFKFSLHYIEFYICFQYYFIHVGEIVEDPPQCLDCLIISNTD